MRLQAPQASPYELDVLGLVFEKGGTAVLADGYLVAGSLTPFQQEFSFYYGAFTQLMDDLEDVQSDRQAGIMTVFSQTAGRWPLDAVTSRLIGFGNGLLDGMRRFQAPGLATLEEIMRKCITPLLIDSASRAGQLLQPGLPGRIGAPFALPLCAAQERYAGKSAPLLHRRDRGDDPAGKRQELSIVCSWGLHYPPEIAILVFISGHNSITLWELS